MTAGSDGSDWPFGGGELGRLIRAFDWSATSLGPVAGWPQSLKTATDLLLQSSVPIVMLWGEDGVMIYNDAYSVFAAGRHPRLLGSKVREGWAEVADFNDNVMRVGLAGGTLAYRDQELTLHRSGRPEQVWMDLDYSPVLDESGRPGGVIAIVVETTERVRAEASLRASNAQLEALVEARTAERERFAQLFEQAPTFMAMLRGPEHRIELANPGYLRLVGDRPVVGLTVAEALPDAVQQGFLGLLDEVYRSGRPFTATATRYAVQTAPDGPVDVRYVDFVFQPIFEGASEVVGIFIEGADVTDRAIAERKLRDLNATLEQRVSDEVAARISTEEALRQSQKMEAVGQLTGGIAHDFNNLLTVIRSSVDLLKRPDLAEERRRRYVDAISDTTDRAAKLTGQLLAFSRREALKPEVFDVVQSVATLGDMVVSLTGSRIRIVTAMPSHASYVNADPSQFDTALINLAVNARDAMDGEGTLTISVDAVAGIPARRLHAARRGAFIAVSVADTGIGVAPADMERIFEPFFTTKEIGKGTGLGLSQVIGFAKQSGGDVAVESVVGTGSRFTLYLPVAAAPAAVNAAPAHDAQLHVDGRGTCVLVVEDNADVGTFATQTLEELGYSPVLAIDAEAALAELAQDPTRFDVVFSDVVMPGMNGIELGQEIRRLHPDLPVVLTSGYSHVLAQNGTYGFELLHKPYSIEQLSRILRKASTWKRRKRMLMRP